MKSPFFSFVYNPSTPTLLLTSYLHHCWPKALEHRRRSHVMKIQISLPAIPTTFLKSIHSIKLHFSIFKLKMFRPISPKTNDPDIFYVEQSSNEPSPPDPKRWFTSTKKEISGKTTREMITLSSFVLPGPQSSHSTLIRMNQRCHSDFDGSYCLSHQAWTIWTCHPFHSIY